MLIQTQQWWISETLYWVIGPRIKYLLYDSIGMKVKHKTSLWWWIDNKNDAYVRWSLTGGRTWIVLGVMAVFYSFVTLWMHKWTTVKIQIVYFKKSICFTVYTFYCIKWLLLRRLWINVSFFHFTILDISFAQLTFSLIKKYNQPSRAWKETSIWD